jgi:hypothetical protein
MKPAQAPRCPTNAVSEREAAPESTRQFVLSWIFAVLVAGSMTTVAVATYQSPHDKLRTSTSRCPQAGYDSWSTDVDPVDLNFTKAVFIEQGWSQVEGHDFGHYDESIQPPYNRFPKLTVTGLCHPGHASTMGHVKSEAP